MIQWQCPILQSNFARNNLDGHNGSGAEGLSYIISAENKLVYKGAHLIDDAIVVKFNKIGSKILGKKKPGGLNRA